MATLGAGLLMLAGCGDKPGAGGLTEEDNLQLNNAAEMLDTSPDSLIANDESALGNGEETVVEPVNEAEAPANLEEDPN